MKNTTGKFKAITDWLEEWKNAIGILIAIVIGIGFAYHEYSKFTKIDTFIGDLKDVKIQKGNIEEIKKLKIHLDHITKQVEKTKKEVCSSYLEAIRPTLDFYRNTYSSYRDNAQQKEEKLIGCKHELMKRGTQTTVCLNVNMGLLQIEEQINSVGSERVYWAYVFQRANEFQDEMSKLVSDSDISIICGLKSEVSVFLNRNRIAK
ncbi:MAG: hypothetical protein AB2817_07065 [Candidatus Thiodiazotropha sp.]